MWRPWWRHLGYVLQVWRHLGVQLWCAVIRHLGSISEVFEHGWVAHLSASDPPPRGGGGGGQTPPFDPRCVFFLFPCLWEIDSTFLRKEKKKCCSTCPLPLSKQFKNAICFILVVNSTTFSFIADIWELKCYLIARQLKYQYHKLILKTLTLWRLHLKAFWTLMFVLYDDVQMDQ